MLGQPDDKHSNDDKNRQQTDQLQWHIERCIKRRDALPQADPRREHYTAKIAAYAAEKQRCWRKYVARNRELAHLSASALTLLAIALHCELIAGESLKTLKSTGRGRG